MFNPSKPSLSYLLAIFFFFIFNYALFPQDLSDEWVLEADSSKKIVISQKHDEIVMSSFGSGAKFVGKIEALDSIKLELKIPNVPDGISDTVLFKGLYYFDTEGGEILDAVFEIPQFDSITKQPRPSKINPVRFIRNRSSERVWNFSKVKEVELGDIKFVDSLFHGRKQLPGYDGRMHNESKAVLIITDYKSSEAMLMRAEYFQVPPNEYKVWLHLTEESGWELRSQLSPQAQNFFNIEFQQGVLAYGWTDFFEDLGNALDVIATGTYELLDCTVRDVVKSIYFE